MEDYVLGEAVGCSQIRAQKWAEPLTRAWEEFDILTRRRQAAFLGQIAHETGGLVILEENLKYSPTGLMTVFGKYFTQPEANAICMFPNKDELIANKVYAGRMGNGDEASGDGWKYKGRGLIQLTGKGNYERAAEALGMTQLVENPWLATAPGHAARIAGWFWKKHGCNELADSEDYEGITRKINGGVNGLADRTTRWNRAKMILGIDPPSASV